MRCFFFLFGILLWFLGSSASAAVIVVRLEVVCGETLSCQEQKKRFSSLKDTYRNITHLRQTLKVLVSTGGVRDFRWDLVDGVGPRELRISFIPKIVLGNIKISGPDTKINEYVERNLKIQTGSWFEHADLLDESLRLRQYLAAKGYPEAQISFKESVRENELALNVVVDPGRPQLLRKILIKTESRFVKSFAERKLLDLVGKNFDIQEVRQKTDELEAELFASGYYLVAIGITPKKVERDVMIEAIIAPVEQWVFDLVRPPAPNTDVKFEFGSVVRNLFKRYRRPLDESMLRVGIAEHLKAQGYLAPDIALSLKRHRNKHDEWVNAARVEINYGVRTRIRSVTFPGAQNWSQNKLLRFWNDQSSDQATAGFYDEASNNAFSEWLRGEYIRDGYVRANIANPKVVLDGITSEATLEYTVSEGARVVVDDIAFSGITDSESTELLELIDTRQGAPFNPFAFTDDVRKVTDYLHARGWYQAEVTNRDADDIVRYAADPTSVRIHFKIAKGKFITFNRLIIVGNKISKGSVIRRKSPFLRGEPISPNQVKDFENALSSLGIFSSVKVQPIFHKGDTPLTDVVVEVTERDYGLIEIAPGYRTDIGLKLSGTVSWLNLFGENISSSITGQVNQRLDFQAFDQRRRDEGRSLLEYNISSQLNVPDLEETSIDYGLALTFQRRRFFSFDADIRRLSNTISRDFGSRYSLSLRHQFESINQFDATEERDNGSFVIGALTPSFTADFRNTRINPTAGAWFNVSNEFANPYFLSQQNNDLTINFYKLISRNRFYIPIPRGTIAISAVGGIQENLAKDIKRDGNGQPIMQDGATLTEGYIPNIKLFRLTGTDIVRGYSDEEINRLANGNDVGEDRVQNKAYMANFKLEPRYFINDSLMAGVFYDAGRIFVDTVDFGELRQSVGVTFKVVTPVGTLDFDYGIKLLRKRGPNGNLEAPGRFHVSIGFF